MTHRRAAAFAPVNIALTKYWGKRDHEINLPLAPSISVTLAELGTLTIVQPDTQMRENAMMVNDVPLDSRGMTKVNRVLSRVRDLADSTQYAGLRAVNTVPTAQGLASSASAFAALATAASHAYGLTLDKIELSALARTGSGSASRSVHGGWVKWNPGQRTDGADSTAEQLLDEEQWPLKIVVAHIGEGPKKTPSTLGMKLCESTSPFFEPWIETCWKDVERCEAAMRERDFAALAHVVEGNALAMHATMMATRPGLVYWQPATLGVIHAVRTLREDLGHSCLFTIDAGPSVVVLCEAADAPVVCAQLGAIAGVTRLTQTRIGPGAQLTEAS
ncbi:MAG TPA: diphosphomevalonate decarboxylase [Myxococcales bacterium]|nr:diphosphomevalonate decarboxylase [Myxococcales bacterium]HAN32145.1 diphosphomevalonate decarboxylase [Myxococcales bacterium]